MCCFHGICLPSGSDSGYGLRCCGAGAGHCNGGLVNALPFTLVVIFLRMFLFINLFWSSMWFKKHLWDCKCEISFFLFSYVVKKSLGSLQVCKYHYFYHISELKNDLQVYKNVISFFSFMCELKKSIVGLQVCNIIFFLLV